MNSKWVAVQAPKQAQSHTLVAAEVVIAWQVVAAQEHIHAEAHQMD